MIAYRCDYNEGDLIDGKYRVESRLGTGSFGNVYKVRDADNHVYALKLLRLWDVPDEIHEELVKRFDMEYRVSNRIDSEYFVRSFDFGQVNGNPYFTMEFCHGGNLAQMGESALNNINKIAHDILRGLHDLHRSGLVHRDLKPENVMIKDNGIAALTDFGIVGGGRLTSKNWLGRPKQVFGTYLYMAPEQAGRERGGVTNLPTTDIFSFGVMMYEIITKGSFPFGELTKSEDLAPYQANAQNGVWNYKLLRRSAVGVQWEKIIRKCIMADYHLRYHTVKEIISDIPEMSWSMGERGGDVKRILITLGPDMGKEYNLADLLTGGKRMLRVGREEDNDIVLSETVTSYVSRYHFTFELDKDAVTWYIRDGQWRMDMKQWVGSTNGTYLGSTKLGSERTRITVGDVVTVGDVKLLIETI